MQIDLILGVVAFSGIVLALVGVIIGARSQLVSTGDVSIEINGDSDNPLVVPAGSKLLQTLADNKIFLSSFWLGFFKNVTMDFPSIVCTVRYALDPANSRMEGNQSSMLTY